MAVTISIVLMVLFSSKCWDGFLDEKRNKQDGTYFMVFYNNNYWVKKILYKASIDVVECDIEAASTTVVSRVDGCAMSRIRERIVIKINKPFLFFIRNKNNGEIIFMGTVYKPETRD